MIVLGDGVQRSAWALQEVRTGRILLAEICEDADAAHRLLAGMRRHQPHRGLWRVVPVVLKVLAAPVIADDR